MWGGTPEADATFFGQLVIMEVKGRQTIRCGYCNRCMLYSVFACTQCIVYSVSTHDHGMER